MQYAPPPPDYSQTVIIQYFGQAENYNKLIVNIKDIGSSVSKAFDRRKQEEAEEGMAIENEPSAEQKPPPEEEGEGEEPPEEEIQSEGQGL